MACSATHAAAGPNGCGTAPPDRSPTWKDGFGYHWFDSHGLATEAPDGSFLGYGKVDFQRASAQGDLSRSNAVQFNVGADEHCAVVGDLGNAQNVGEFTVKRAPRIVQMPWLTRDGNLFRSSGGRTTILRGVDWPYNEEPFEPPYNLREGDFARIASWGINLLRIRIAAYRSGYLPGHPAEPGYWQHLDQLIAAANRHGIYVLLSTVTSDTQDLVVDNQVYDRLKFVGGTSQHRFWLAFEA